MGILEEYYIALLNNNKGPDVIKLHVNVWKETFAYSAPIASFHGCDLRVAFNLQGTPRLNTKLVRVINWRPVVR